MQLSPHFSLAEACKSALALRAGLDNTAPEEVWPALCLVAKSILEPLRERFGPFTPSSFYRSPEVNRLAKGRPTSQHVRGEAVDLELGAFSNAYLAGWIANSLDFDQLILEFYEPGIPTSGWVHVSFIGPGNRRQILTQTKDRTFPGLVA